MLGRLRLACVCRHACAMRVYVCCMCARTRALLINIMFIQIMPSLHHRLFLHSRNMRCNSLEILDDLDALFGCCVKHWYATFLSMPLLMLLLLLLRMLCIHFFFTVSSRATLTSAHQPLSPAENTHYTHIIRECGWSRGKETEKIERPEKTRTRAGGNQSDIYLCALLECRRRWCRSRIALWHSRTDGTESVRRKLKLHFEFNKISSKSNVRVYAVVGLTSWISNRSWFSIRFEQLCTLYSLQLSDCPLRPMQCEWRMTRLCYSSDIFLIRFIEEEIEATVQLGHFSMCVADGTNDAEHETWKLKWAKHT